MNITKEKLLQAEDVSQIIRQYPSNWIHHYNSVRISIKGENENYFEAPDKVLNQAQKDFLASLDWSDQFNITVSYLMGNAATDEMEERELNVDIALVPEHEASYPGGYDTLIKTLKAETFPKLSEQKEYKEEPVIISFIVEKDGQLSQAKINRSSRIDEVDQIMLDAVNNLSPWSPALDEKGNAVSQAFELQVGIGDGC